MREKGASSLPFFFLPLIKGEQKNAASGGLAGKRKEKTRRNNRQKKEKRERDVFFFFFKQKNLFRRLLFFFLSFFKRPQSTFSLSHPNLLSLFLLSTDTDNWFYKKRGERGNKEGKQLLTPPSSATTTTTKKNLSHLSSLYFSSASLSAR